MLVECTFNKKLDEHGNIVREWLIPDGFTIIDTYTPYSCPWDYYGMKHQRELQKVLANVCNVAFPNILLTLANPIGSGPNGAIRFGDNMTPGTYRLAVPINDIANAKNAIHEHKQKVREWLNGEGEMPSACR